ncbi:acyclic terpene utilization AtuA family protein [Burkholderia sp. WSM2230]|uniref:acyclic terpene utilization AtuA family protein n=1 Tax=Burkholderia sp. WSM2230 TaxID=944435 RepID=UPI0004052AD7|nr:acyclic terpene utilization AtuA family protein [Burkholderia sp. WSM2230]
MTSKTVRMMSASGILGYGFPEASIRAALERKPHMFGVDGGSSDPGPYYLGSGKTLNSRLAMKRDLSLLLRAAIGSGVPMMVGTAGGAGGEPHLQVCAELVREIAREHDLHFRLALIHAEQPKEYLKRRLGEGRIRALDGAPPLDEAALDGARRIVGMMGPEPYRAALEAGAQVILGGRGTDPSPWVALAMHHGLPAAPSWYAGKMLECACNAAIPKKHDCLLVTVGEDYVEAEPMNPELRCTPLSVAVQALHETASPVIRHEPGGLVDTRDCRIEALTDRVVRVTGMRWQPQPYSVKLEGVRSVGFSAVTFAATRDPGLIAQLDTFVEFVRESTATKVRALGIADDAYRLVLRVYGRNGVMGPWEPASGAMPVEMAIVAEVIGVSQEIASAALSLARVTLLHSDFAGRMCREGNMAFPFSPSDIERGEVYEFMLQHVVLPDDPYEMFPIDYEEV